MKFCTQFCTQFCNQYCTQFGSLFLTIGGVASGSKPNGVLAIIVGAVSGMFCVQILLLRRSQSVLCVPAMRSHARAHIPLRRHLTPLQFVESVDLRYKRPVRCEVDLDSPALGGPLAAVPVRHIQALALVEVGPRRVVVEHPQHTVVHSNPSVIQKQAIHQLAKLQVQFLRQKCNYTC